MVWANVRCQFLWLPVIPAEKFCDSWVLSTSVCGTGSFSAHTVTHSINGSAHETQNFSAGITENKKSGNKYCQQTHLTPPNIHDIVESRLRISQEGAHHLGCGLFLWYPFVVSEEKGETIWFAWMETRFQTVKDYHRWFQPQFCSSQNFVLR